MEKVDVYYLVGRDVVVPTQGYEGDFASDLISSEGRLVPPLTFKSVIIPTKLQTAFDESLVGMKLALRSGVAANTPLLLSNAPAVIEGTYRGTINVIVRNSFIDNSLVDFVFDLKGNKVPLREVPAEVKKKAREAFDAESTNLGYDKVEKGVRDTIFKTLVPRGTVYVPKNSRIAQMYFSPKIQPNFIPVEELPTSERSNRGLGSSGTEFQGGGHNGSDHSK